MTVISSSSGGTIIIRAIRNLRSTVGAISPSNGWFGNLHLEPLRRLRHTNRRGDFVISRYGAGHKAFEMCALGGAHGAPASGEATVVMTG